jgi:hypothetical protein
MLYLFMWRYWFEKRPSSVVCRTTCDSPESCCPRFSFHNTDIYRNTNPDTGTNTTRYRMWEELEFLMFEPTAVRLAFSCNNHITSFCFPRFSFLVHDYLWIETNKLLFDLFYVQASWRRQELLVVWPPKSRSSTKFSLLKISKRLLVP